MVPSTNEIPITGIYQPLANDSTRRIRLIAGVQAVGGSVGFSKKKKSAMGLECSALLAIFLRLLFLIFFFFDDRRGI